MSIPWPGLNIPCIKPLYGAPGLAVASASLPTPQGTNFHFLPVLENDHFDYEANLESIRKKLNLPIENLAKNLLTFLENPSYSSLEEGCYHITLASMGLTFLGIMKKLSESERETFYNLCNDPKLTPFLVKIPYQAPDTSVIRMYNDLRDDGTVSPEGIDPQPTVGFCFSTLPAMTIATPFAHTKVSEVWFVIGGEGLQRNGNTCFPMNAGDSFTILPGEHTEFLNYSENSPLIIAIIDIPKWLGPQDAYLVPSVFKSPIEKMPPQQQQFFSILHHGTLDEFNALLDSSFETLRTPEVIDELVTQLLFLGGKINFDDFEPRELSWLIEKHYINEEGFIQQAFKDLMYKTHGKKSAAITDFGLGAELFEKVENSVDYKVRAFASYALMRLGDVPLTPSDFAFIENNEKLFQVLKEKYLKSDGRVNNNFKILKAFADLELPEEYSLYKQKIFDTIHEKLQRAKYTPNVYQRWSRAIDGIKKVAMATEDKFAQECKSNIRILGTYRDGSTSFGIDYAVRKKESKISFSRPMLRPLGEQYYMIDGVALVVLKDPHTQVITVLKAGQGDIVDLPQGQIACFASLDKKTDIKLLVPTKPSFEACNPADFCMIDDDPELNATLRKLAEDYSKCD